MTPDRLSNDYCRKTVGRREKRRSADNKRDGIKSEQANDPPTVDYRSWSVS